MGLFDLLNNRPDLMDPNSLPTSPEEEEARDANVQANMAQQANDALVAKQKSRMLAQNAISGATDTSASVPDDNSDSEDEDDTPTIVTKSPNKKDESQDKDLDNSNELDEDNSDDVPKQAPMSESDRLQELLNKASGKTPVQQRMNTSDAINALLGKQDADLEAAKARRKQLNLLAGLTQAGQTAAAAFSPLANLSTNPEVADRIRQQAQQPVQDVLMKNQVHQQALKDALEKQQVSNGMDKEDPNSDVSKLYNQLAQESIKKAGLGINLPPNMSASNIEKIMPGIENMANRHEQSMTRQTVAQQNALMKQGLQDQAQAQKQTQALTQTQQMLESARGNPEVQQALKDRYAASKANALIGQNYDPNNMSPAQVHLLASEVGKIATGGVPSVAEMDALTPQTINSKLASVSQALTNKPSPASAGAFIKQYQDYLNDLNKNAQNVIEDKFGRVIETRKKAIGDDNYNTLKEQYLKPPVPQATKSAQYGADVLKYASDHNITPSQAQAIKIQRTSGGQ